MGNHVEEMTTVSLRLPEQTLLLFFFVVVYYPNPDVVSLGMYCTQGRIRLTDGVSRKKKSNESAWDFRDI